MQSQPSAAAGADAFIRLPRVVELTGRSETRIYADIAEGTFPRQVKIGRRAVAWKASEVQAWIAGRAREVAQ